MDSNLRRGVLISFIIAGVVAMIVGVRSLNEASIEVGIALLILATIWWFLFWNPKSPVKRYWSLSDKLMFVIPIDRVYKSTVRGEYISELAYKPTVSKEIISVWVDLRSQSSYLVEKIVLKIGRRGIRSFEWSSHEVLAHEHKFLDFKRPGWLRAGEYEAKLIAYTPEGYSKSRKFILEV
jgi:hypothetical protein